MSDASHLYAILAEFSDQESLLAAVNKCRDRYVQVDAYAPHAVDGLAEALGFRRNAVPLITLLGGVIGGGAVYFLQWYTAVITYPIDAGGRPLHSWPAFVPATFEITVLFAALAAFFGMLLLNGLPRLNHPLFNAADFDLASRDRFFVAIRSSDPAFEDERTRDFLQSLAPLRIIEVPM